MGKKLNAAMKVEDREKKIDALSSVIFSSIESLIDISMNEVCTDDNLDQDDDFESSVKAHITQHYMSKYGATK